MMQAIGQVFGQVLAPIVLMTAVGYVLQRNLHLDIRTVSRLVFYVLAPCLIYHSLLTHEFDLSVTWRSIAFAAVHMAIMAGLAYGLSQRWGYRGSLGSAFLVATILLNNGNYGLPLNLFAFGQEGFGYAVVLFMFNSLAGSTISIYLMARGQNGATLALKRTLATPVVWAMVLGLLSRAAGWLPNSSLMHMIEMTGRAAIPVFLVVLGMSLVGIDTRTTILPVTRLTILRMVGGPGLAILIGRLFGLTGVAYAVAVLQAAMPTAVNSIVICNEFEAVPDFVAGSVLFTTLTSLITLPALLLWLM